MKTKTSRAWITNILKIINVDYLKLNFYSERKVKIRRVIGLACGVCINHKWGLSIKRYIQTRPNSDSSLCLSHGISQSWRGWCCRWAQNQEGCSRLDQVPALEPWVSGESESSHWLWGQMGNFWVWSQFANLHGKGPCNLIDTLS